MASATKERPSLMYEEAERYLHRLGDLVRRIEVSDFGGGEHGLDEGAALAVERLLLVRSAGRKAMVVGNGGSQSIASHVQTDLCNAIGLRTLTFDGPGTLTALSNDYGYECVFERPIQLWADAGDLLIAISSSGRSENILRAVRAARARDCQIITLSGFRADNPLRKSGDINFYVPSEAYGFVEVAHAAFAHFLADSAMVARLRQVRHVTSEVWTAFGRSS